MLLRSTAVLLSAIVVLSCGLQPTLSPRTLRYVALGASDSVGVGSADPQSGSWPARLATRLPSGSKYTNLGVSGSTLSAAFRDQLPAAVSNDPDVVTIWLAVNDLVQGVLPEIYGSQLGQLLDGLEKRTRARIFVGDVPDLTQVPAFQSAPESRGRIADGVAAYNRVIAGAVSVHGDRVVLVDLHTGTTDVVRGGAVSADGFHPNDRGYEAIAQRFAESLQRSGITVR
ncbi:MAG: GDSL-type esterase/lipase family protein [Chloroflexota bacterium]|nr:GDSL-type esterase/lipase family protein [Chloroflexota bacterium]